MNANAPLIASLILKVEARDVLSDEEKHALAGLLDEVRIVENGTDMVSDGSRPTSSTLIVSGYAMRYKLLKGGERQITEVHVPGDFVDLHSFLLKEMDHSVAAIGRCRIATASHEKLTVLTRDYPHLTRVLWLMTLIDSAIHREWLVAMGRRPAVGQMAHLICELYLRLNVVKAASDLTFSFPLTQAELGDLLGLSAVHVNRVLQELRGRELITWRGHTIVILDWPGLQQAAEFDPRYLHLKVEPR